MIDRPQAIPRCATHLKDCEPAAELAFQRVVGQPASAAFRQAIATVAHLHKPGRAQIVERRAQSMLQSAAEIRPRQAQELRQLVGTAVGTAAHDTEQLGFQQLIVHDARVGATHEAVVKDAPTAALVPWLAVPILLLTALEAVATVQWSVGQWVS